MTAPAAAGSSQRVVGRYAWVEPGVWEISADPDVMIRLKRILPRVEGTRAGTFRIAGTDEVARDLVWILDRWPMDATRVDAARLRRACTQHVARESAIQQILDGGSFTHTGAGWVSAALELRSYQSQARDMVLATGGTLIVDDLGLGKTATGLALLENPAARPALAVTLTDLPKQWLRELRKFYPDLRGFEITNTTPLPKSVQPIRTGSGQSDQPSLFDDANARHAGLPDADLYVLSYSKLSKWQHHLAGRVRTVIFDEAQDLRNIGTKKYNAAAHIAGKADWATGLTATPCYNSGSEIHAILSVIHPGALGDRHEFAREWCRSSYGGPAYSLDSKSVAVADPDGLRAHLLAQGLMMRRTRADVGIELPGVEIIEQYVPSDESVIDRGTSDAAAIARIVLDDQKVTGHDRWRASGELDWRLRQATGIAKAPFVAQFVKLLLESEEKILLFGWHRAVWDLWMEQLSSYKPRMFTGTETPAAKQRALDDFVNGDARILMMSIRSGAGIDGLQDVCSTLVFGELDWAPGVHKQCIGRAYRPGQTRHVSAYFCITDAGADPVMQDTLDLKSMSIDAIVDGVTDTILEPVGNNDRIKQLARTVLDRHHAPATERAGTV